MKISRLLWLILPAALIVGTTPMSADALHGFCWGASTCSDNGHVTPTNTNPPNFGFTASSGPETGDFLVKVLVPNNETASGFTITGTQGGTTNTSAISATAALVSSTPWTGGKLDTYLGISASPTNPIGAFLPCSQNPSSCGVSGGKPDAGATGYFVYEADLGQTQLQGNSNSAAGPLLNILPALPMNSLIVGFLNVGTSASPDWVATSNSGAIFESGTPTTAVPEPMSLALMGLGMIGLAGGAMRRRRKASQQS